MNRKLVFVLISSLFSAVAMAAGPHWEYEGERGPEQWGSLDSKFKACSTGKRQSPINIDTKLVEKGGLKAIPFSYVAGPAEIVNNGHTIQVNLPNSGSARFDGMEYKLVQFHFHTPSEEKIDSMASHMVAHLVHKAGDSRLAVVGVLFKLGKENVALKPIFDNLPAKGGQTRPLNLFNPAEILPTDAAYFGFTGSLTTPPCSEEVRWHVMKNPIEISYAQLAAFKKLYKMNARPVQPVNGRRIQMSYP